MGQENPRTKPPENYTVRVGSTYNDEGGYQVKVSNVYVKAAGNHDDIGMLKLRQPLSLGGSRMQAVKLPTSARYPEGEMSYVQGKP